MKGWGVVAQVGSASYGSEKTDRVSVGINGDIVSASFAKNISDRQDLDAVSLSASYPLMDRLVTPTLVVSYAHYKPDELSPLRDALGIAGGATVRPSPSLMVDAQLQWMNNRVYKSDTRLFVRFSYLFNDRLNVF